MRPKFATHSSVFFGTVDDRVNALKLVILFDLLRGVGGGTAQRQCICFSPSSLRFEPRRFQSFALGFLSVARRGTEVLVINV